MPGGYRWNPTGSKNPAYKGGLVTSKDWFVGKYEKDGLSLRKIAKESGCSLRTAARWAETHNTRLRPSGSGDKPKGKNSHHWKGGLPSCACGKVLSRPSKSRLTKGVLLCSKCKGATKRGVAHPNWKGLADIMSLVRGHIKRSWTPQVLFRDNYSCQVCGRKADLVAHHLCRLETIVSSVLRSMSLGSSADRYKAFEVIKEMPIINNIKNGVTVCKQCHRNIHRGRRFRYTPIIKPTFDRTSGVDYEYEVMSIKIVDWKILNAQVKLGFSVTSNIEFQLYTPNTTEVVHSPSAKAELDRLLRSGPLRVVSEKSDKYGRWLGTFYAKNADGSETNVNDALLTGGFALPYFGVGPKP